MSGMILHAAGVVTPTAVLPLTAVRVENGRIAAIGAVEQIQRPGDQVIHDPDAMLIPGLIDVHLHGGSGRHFHKEDAAGLDELMRTLASWGVTGALPTLGAMMPDDLTGAVERLRDLASRQTDGARVLGIHLEGPYFNPRKKGAQYAEAIRLPDREETERLLKLANGLVRLMTLAVEMEGADGVLEALAEHGAIASVGHSEATLADLQRTVPLGVRHATHTGNAMVGIHHRDPGTFGAVLTMDEIHCELIGDGIHIDPTVMKLIWRAKGTDHVVLVSDATASAGLPDGEYHQGHRTVIIKDGKASLPDGTLAGSCSPLGVSVRNMVNLCGVPIHEAVRMATLNPAKVAGYGARTGSIEVGKDADLVLVNGAFQPQLTMVLGEIVYRAES